MTAVADSSPLVILAKIGCFSHLSRLFSHVYISAEVYEEVVIAGTGLPGASEVAGARWIEIKRLQDATGLLAEQQRHGLGAGEMSAILLCEQLGGNPLLIDDYRARQLARSRGLEVLGTIGLLEGFYVRGHLNDLRGVFQRLISNNVYIDPRLLDRRLRSFGLPPL